MSCSVQVFFFFSLASHREIAEQSRQSFWFQLFHTVVFDESNNCEEIVDWRRPHRLGCGWMRKSKARLKRSKHHIVRWRKHKKAAHTQLSAPHFNDLSIRERIRNAIACGEICRWKIEKWKIGNSKRKTNLKKSLIRNNGWWWSGRDWAVGLGRHNTKINWLKLRLMFQKPKLFESSLLETWSASAFFPNLSRTLPCYRLSYARYPLHFYSFFFWSIFIAEAFLLFI